MISLRGLHRDLFEMLHEAVSWLWKTMKLIARMLVISLMIAVGVFAGSIGANYFGPVMVKITETQVITSLNVMDVNAPVFVIPPPEPSKSVPDFKPKLLPRGA
jgi:hypothetical protein